MPGSAASSRSQAYGAISQAQDIRSCCPVPHFPNKSVVLKIRQAMLPPGELMGPSPLGVLEIRMEEKGGDGGIYLVRRATAAATSRVPAKR
jgi:hypothetical protein